MMFSTDFLVRSAFLTWSDILWGYKRGLIGWTVPVQIAQNKISTIGASDMMEIWLSRLTKDEDWKVSDLLEKLSAQENQAEEVAKKRWLYLHLLWTYENRGQMDDVLGGIEVIYADFDYPDEISPFVGYLPPSDGYDPRAHTRLQSKERILRKLKEYLDTTKLQLQ